MSQGRSGTASWLNVMIAFGCVTCAQLWLIAVAGTDIPFHDQWDVEGRQLYPQWREGTLTLAQIFQPHNEHRIVWTHLLNLALFQANGGHWDPLVQQTAGAILHGLTAGVLVWLVGGSPGRTATRWVPWIVAVAFLPMAAWHNALWGFQSQVYFSVLLSLLSLGLMTGQAGVMRWWTGMAAAVAGLFAMGPSFLVPPVLLVIALIHGREQRWDWWRIGGVIGLLVLAWGLHKPESAHAELQVVSVPGYLAALGRLAAWPHVEQPWAALTLNLPWLLLFLRRLHGRQPAVPGEFFLLALGLWVLALAAATSWVRGGGAEFVAGVPSRYVDFMVLLPLANLGCFWLLLQSSSGARTRLATVLALCWSGFLLIGWIGISAEALRRVIAPRARDVEAPVRLIQEFQRTGDAAFFSGQPRLLVPHPNPISVQSVLQDPRMSGALPPSLQPGLPTGPLSRAVRVVLQRQ